MVGEGPLIMMSQGEYMVGRLETAPGGLKSHLLSVTDVLCKFKQLFSHLRVRVLM